MKLLLDIQGAQSESRNRGIGRQTRTLAKALIAHAGDHEVSVLLNRTLRENFEELRADFIALVPPDRILTFDVPTPTAERDAQNAWRTRAAELIRESYIAAQKPDIVHIGSLFEGFVDDAVVSIGALCAPHATAVTLHDLIPLANPTKYLEAVGPRRHYLRKAQALKRADLLLAVSESARQEAISLLHIPPGNVSVMFEGVDEQFQRIGISSQEVASLRSRYRLHRGFILYVGAVDPRKNPEALIEAFSRIPLTTRSSQCLAFIGLLHREERTRIRALGARFGVRQDEIVFCGQVSDDDLVKLYNLCDLFVFPSLHEGFGLPALEAMASGAPCLAANRTSLPEVVGRPEMLFDPDDPGDLANKMTHVLQDQEFQGSLRAWGFEKAQQFTWEKSAKKAWLAFESLHAKRRALTNPSTFVALAKMPKLAFVSPLPSDRTGIANYSSELLPELARYYNIECIVKDTKVSDEWISANYTTRDVAYFQRNARTYDRIIYNMGNSHFHAHMLPLLREAPGIVILHDFFLSDLIDWMSNVGHFESSDFLTELYHTHGLTALAKDRSEGRLHAVNSFPTNQIVFRNSTGVIVHSNYVVERARELYGDAVEAHMTVVPQIRAPYSLTARTAARGRLSIAEKTFVVCSFGIISSKKLYIEIVKAWRMSKCGNASDTLLIFAGENSEPQYSTKLEEMIRDTKGQSNVRIAGYTPMSRYRDYLASADLAIQLRTNSRGETSSAILDCFAAGLPVIANACGPTAELPPRAADMLPEHVGISELSARIDAYYLDRALGRELGLSARDYVLLEHHPAYVGEKMHLAIERFAATSVISQQATVLEALANFNAPAFPTDDDFASVAISLAQNSEAFGLRQILCDVTVLADQDARTGIQRVVRSIVSCLIKNPPVGYRVEPVRVSGTTYRYARYFSTQVLDLPVSSIGDDAVEYRRGDLYLAIDWVPDRLLDVLAWLENFRSVGGKVVYCVYDLLPLQLPQFFPDFMADVTLRWFEAALATADQFVCISRTVADDVVNFALALQEAPTQAKMIDYFHIGSDLATSVPTRGIPSEANHLFAEMSKRDTFLMVGTVEPRKGHQQVLSCFEILWAEKHDVSLVIVGKHGWMVDQIAQQIRTNPEHNRRLFWLHDISDEMLDEVYKKSSALIAASYGEGFGLPLIEAAWHKIPIIARDIPVFREVATSYATYFTGTQPRQLAEAILEWQTLKRRNRAPVSSGMPYLTWEQSTAQLVERLFDTKHYRIISAQARERTGADQQF